MNPLQPAVTPYRIADGIQAVTNQPIEALCSGADCCLHERIGNVHAHDQPPFGSVSFGGAKNLHLIIDEPQSGPTVIPAHSILRLAATPCVVC
ncbi:MAG: hypothetical protein WAM97_12385 [Acidimicrobiales bacterium]